jgi:hypothetical protein
VRVHPGTYHESLQIDNDGIRLQGNHVRLVEPASPANTVCNQFGGGSPASAWWATSTRRPVRSATTSPGCG